MKTDERVRLVGPPTDWFQRTLPHPPGAPSPREYIPVVGFVITIMRVANDDPNLLDRFSGHFIVPVYHVAVSVMILQLASVALRLF